MNNNAVANSLKAEGKRASQTCVTLLLIVMEIWICPNIDNGVYYRGGFTFFNGSILPDGQSYAV